MRRIRVIHITNDLEIGGVQEVILSLLKYIDKRRFEPYLATVAGKGVWIKRARSLGIKTRYFPCIRRTYLFKWIDIVQILRLSIWMRKEGIDLIHTHLFLAGTIGRIAALFAGIKRIIHTEHSTYTWKRFYHILIDRLLARITRRIITVSEAVRDFTIRQEGIPASKFIVIYNGIELDGLDIKASRLDLNIPLVGSIGRLVPQKGHQLFLDAIPEIIREVKEARFLIVGDGPMRDLLHKRAKWLNISEKVVFTGFVEDLREILSKLAILVHTPRLEGFGLVLCWAMAFGIPIVASSIGGIPEVLDSRAGILIDPCNPYALAKAVIELLKDKEKAREMGEAGRRLIRERFNIGPMVLKTERLYLSIR